MYNQPLTCDDIGYDFPHWWGWCPVCRAEKDRERSLKIEEAKVQELRRANDLKEAELNTPQVRREYSQPPQPRTPYAPLKPTPRRTGVVPIDPS
jgi:predicted ATP-dependent serine protease